MPPPLLGLTTTDCLSILRAPPPRSTLFPSTPLFRSERRLLPALAAAATTDDLDSLGARILQAKQRAERVEIVRRRDRKSTRLNSSHPSISYAVFCLKKNIPGLSPRATRKDLPAPQRV